VTTQVRHAPIITGITSKPSCKISTQRLAAWRKRGRYLPAIQPHLSAGCPPGSAARWAPRGGRGSARPRGRDGRKRSGSKRGYTAGMAVVGIAGRYVKWQPQGRLVGWPAVPSRERPRVCIRPYELERNRSLRWQGYSHCAAMGTRIGIPSA